MAKFYLGNPQTGKVYVSGAPLYARDAVVTSYELDPRNDLYDHSPDGFLWGYSGSGPAQLALAVLADYTNDDQFAVQHHQEFKRELVASQDTDKHFEVRNEAIFQWVEQRRKE